MLAFRETFPILNFVIDEFLSCPAEILNNILQPRNNIVPVVIRDDYFVYGILRAMGKPDVSKLDEDI